jgi:hypothetical protein
MGNEKMEEGEAEEEVELKELPCRRHLDCGKGGEDATWLERKDVPIDYEMPELSEARLCWAGVVMGRVRWVSSLIYGRTVSFLYIFKGFVYS